MRQREGDAARPVGSSIKYPPLTRWYAEKPRNFLLLVVSISLLIFSAPSITLMKPALKTARPGSPALRSIIRRCYAHRHL